MKDKKNDLQGILEEESKPSRWNNFKYHLYTGLEILGRAAANIVPGGATAQACITRTNVKNIDAYILLDIAQGVCLLGSLADPGGNLLAAYNCLVAAKCAGNLKDMYLQQRNNHYNTLRCAT